MIGIGIVYAIYCCIHLFLFKSLKTNFSYSNIYHEAQYLVNYTFMVLNLFIYTYVFRNNDTTKLKKSVMIMLTIYIISIYISILTGTSSTTYIEKIGFKGWFESGNSLSAILTLGLFITIPVIAKENKKYYLILLMLIGLFMVFLIGTRVRFVWFFYCIWNIWNFRNYDTNFAKQ